MSNTYDEIVVADDYTIDDLLAEANADLENVQTELLSSKEDLEDALEDASKKLKKNLEKLAKHAKKEIKSDVFEFYHDNKQVVKSDLKTMNTFVKDVLHEIKDDINVMIDDAEDRDERKALKKARNKVVKFSRKYNHKYTMLKLKLDLGNAEVDIKNFFS